MYMKEDSGCFKVFLIFSIFYIGFVIYKLQDSIFFTQTIELIEDCEEIANLKDFRNIKPNMKISEIYSMLGKEDDLIIDNDRDEPAHDLLYYNSRGRLRVYASSNSPSYKVGMIEFKPKFEIYIYDILKSNYFHIKDSTKRIKIFCRNSEYIFYVNNLKIIRIEYWN